MDQALPPATEANPKSRSDRSSSQKTLHPPSPKKIFSRKNKFALNWQIRQQRNRVLEWTKTITLATSVVDAVARDVITHRLA